MCEKPWELEPREQVLQLVVDAAVLVRHAVIIAEGLPDVGHLPAELRDAVGILAQATTRLLENRPNDGRPQPERTITPGVVILR